MRLFKRRPPDRLQAEPVPGERVYLRYDDNSQVEFNDYQDALHHVHVLGAVGVVELCREADGAQLFSRPDLNKLGVS